MGKRQKAEMLCIVQEIIRLYNADKLTFEEIEKKLRGDGYDISRESIRRTVKSNKQIALDLNKAREEAVELVNVFRDNPATDTQEVIVDFLTAKAFEYTKSIESIAFESPADLGKFINSLTRSKSEIAKLRLSFQSGADKAKAVIYDELATVLNDRPELLAQLQEAIARIEVRA